MIWIWPVEVSAGVLKIWFAPLFGHSMARPPDAAESFTTAKGENRLWLERLSSSTIRLLPPPELLLEELDEELELLDEELLELEDELELEELEELLLEDELLEPPPGASLSS